MRILKLWVVTSFMFGVGEIFRAWFAFQNPDNTPKSVFQFRFWETLLAGSMQKIVSGFPSLLKAFLYLVIRKVEAKGYSC